VTMLELDDISAGSSRITTARRRSSAITAFPATICASPNDVIVHGIPTDYRLEEGDMLSIDSGAIYEGYHGDAAFTMAIGEVPAEASN
jgi:methionyl aminopeptidase